MFLTTQNNRDYALYNSSLKTAINGTVIPSITPDYPRIIDIGPSYFESYSTWPNTKFIHGFNMGKNGSHNLQLLLDTVPLACDALGNGKLLAWELGNEPDDFKNSPEAIVRPTNWTEKDYLHEWFSKTAALKRQMEKSCPELATVKYMAPSFGGITGTLKALTTWQEGLHKSKNIGLNSEHKCVFYLYFSFHKT